MWMVSGYHPCIHSTSPTRPSISSSQKLSACLKSVVMTLRCSLCRICLSSANGTVQKPSSWINGHKPLSNRSPSFHLTASGTWAPILRCHCPLCSCPLRNCGMLLCIVFTLQQKAYPGWFGLQSGLLGPWVIQFASSSWMICVSNWKIASIL